MNIEELYELAKWADKQIYSPGILNSYQDIQNTLSSNSQPNNAKQPIEPKKNSLIESLISVDFSLLTSEQITFLESINIKKYLGTEGEANVDDILFRNSLDSKTAAKKFSQIVSLMSSAQERFTKISESLQDIVKAPLKPDSESVLLRIEFENDASIGNVVDLKHWANEWHSIARGLAIAVDKTPEDFRIIGARNGSVILDIFVVRIIVKLLSGIMLDILNVANKYQEYRAAAIRLQAMDIKDSSIVEKLKEEADTSLKEGVDKIVEANLQKLNITSAPRGDKHKPFKDAVTKLTDFTAKGGAIDYYLPPSSSDDAEEDSTDDPEILEIRANIDEIRKLDDVRHQYYLDHKIDDGD